MMTVARFPRCGNGPYDDELHGSLIVGIVQRLMAIPWSYISMVPFAVCHLSCSYQKMSYQTV